MSLDEYGQCACSNHLSVCVHIAGFLAEGLQRVPAGVGSVIIDSQPLTVAVVAALVFGESITPLGVFGLFLGVAGLLLLELPEDQLALLSQLDFGTAPILHLFRSCA